jgi:hypothetical protein
MVEARREELDQERDQQRIARRSLNSSRRVRRRL